MVCGFGMVLTKGDKKRLMDQLEMDCGFLASQVTHLEILKS